MSLDNPVALDGSKLVGQLGATTMYDLTSFQRDLMYMIVGLDDPSGLTIKGELEEYYETDVNQGRLYPNLDALVDKGLVNKGKLDDRTNIYTLTRRGHRELDARREWENDQSTSLIAESVNEPAPSEEGEAAT